MKILYVASNPQANATLLAENEITELQSAAIYGRGRRMDFLFLPALPYEELETHIWNYRPDIVHISAHGDKEQLTITSSSRQNIGLPASALNTLLAPAPPKLVYLNACDSADIAKGICDTVRYAIGTTAPITNFAARKGAIAFYRAIGQGRTLRSAFESSRSTVEVLSSAGGSKVETILFPENGIEDDAVLHEPTRIVAHFESHDFKLNKHGVAKLEIGVAGCPDQVRQVVFCTDDETFIEDDSELETSLCSVNLGYAWKGEFWLDEVWQTFGDMRIFALLISANGEHVSVSSTVCDALEEFYQVYFGSKAALSPELIEVIATLRSEDGARLSANRRRGLTTPQNSPTRIKKRRAATSKT
ncbi:hypothetical protein DFR52_101941 [Hoeflea marina]|uniref:CHAT domain-containing protein n=1 Tax=Hoeflea marina TaxID=274592 RepID=A0A317PTI2_9HYPH|nr:hypothetical protein [Hoeflea marina]PWW04247.1 hypothetical protein DFR52_101941 [Hoeflea marina]